jgi:hypothetical protein
VFISNIPQAVAPSADLASSGWGTEKLGRLWFMVVLACGVAAALGFLATDLTGAVQGDRAAALAARGLLAMLTNSLMPKRAMGLERCRCARQSDPRASMGGCGDVDAYEGVDLSCRHF